MLQAELDEHGDGPDLDAMAAARVAHFSGFDVVFAVRLDESERGEAIDELAAPWAR